MSSIGTHDQLSAYYTAVCSGGHTILMHEPCDTMVLHESSVRLPYLVRAAEGHDQACHALGQGRHSEPPF